MKGKVKWFDRNRNFGFLVGEDGQEYFYGMNNIKGTDLPLDNGDIVEFIPSRNKKGLKAKEVVLIEKSISKRDDREFCRFCNKKMVPRIITYHGAVQKSVCPFCGKTHKTFGPCFIATAVYRDYDAPEVLVLRKFRDKTLLKNKVGRAFVALYYKYSPPVADYLKDKPIFSKIVRFILNNLFVKLLSK